MKHNIDLTGIVNFIRLTVYNRQYSHKLLSFTQWLLLLSYNIADMVLGVFL